MVIAFPWWRVFLYKWRYLTVCARCAAVAVFISHLSRKPDPKTDRLVIMTAWSHCPPQLPDGSLYGVSGQWQPKTWPHPWPHPWRLGGLVPSPVRCADLLRAEHGMGVLVSFTVANVYLAACHLPIARILLALTWLLDFWAFLVLAHPPRVPAPLPNMYHNIIKNSAAQVVTSTAPMFRRVVVGVGYRLLENITVKNRACRI